MKVEASKAKDFLNMGIDVIVVVLLALKPARFDRCFHLRAVAEILIEMIRKEKRRHR
jgi:hypothetical protein